jgi:hypothetical protein
MTHGYGRKVCGPDAEGGSGGENVPLDVLGVHQPVVSKSDRDVAFRTCAGDEVIGGVAHGLPLVSLIGEWRTCAIVERPRLRSQRAWAASARRSSYACFPRRGLFGISVRRRSATMLRRRPTARAGLDAGGEYPDASRSRRRSNFRMRCSSSAWALRCGSSGSERSLRRKVARWARRSAACSCVVWCHGRAGRWCRYLGMMSGRRWYVKRVERLLLGREME